LTPLLKQTTVHAKTEQLAMSPSLPKAPRWQPQMRLALSPAMLNSATAAAAKQSPRRATKEMQREVSQQPMRSVST